MMKLLEFVFFGISRRHSYTLTSHFQFLSRRAMLSKPRTIRFCDIYSPVADLGINIIFCLAFISQSLDTFSVEENSIPSALGYF